MKHYNKQDITDDLRYLELLSKEFPNIQSVATELINLQAIQNLPKGTEHFLSDLHGEDESFLHLLKSGSGVIRRKIDDVFLSTITVGEKNDLATLVYYPHEMMDKINVVDDHLHDWYHVTLHRLVLLCKEVSKKYTRSKVRKALPKEYSYIIEELLHERVNEIDKFQYYDKIIQTIIDINQAENFIVEISKVIQRLAIDRLHIIGDVYDRGPGPHKILDKLIEYHSVDFQWGNHDILWMGASVGSLVCIASVLRICARYGNLEILDEGYGINLLPIGKFAMETYEEYDPCFVPKNTEEMTQNEIDFIAKMHMAISIIQFKLEGEVIKNNPDFLLEDRLVLDRINYDNLTMTIDGVEYPLNTKGFPTINPTDPYKLTNDEMDVMNKVRAFFMQSEKLQRHMSFLFTTGSMYKVYNKNLLFHACIPFNENGKYQKVKFNKKSYSGKALLDYLDTRVRESYASKDCLEHDADIFWYLWTGKHSPLYGRTSMKTFERYFITDKATHKEENNVYYKLIADESVVDGILEDFDLFHPDSKIINGHTPVKVSNGENPVKASGKVIIIDGGLSKAYHHVTGIAGYTLIYNSNGMLLAAHQPFDSKNEAIKMSQDIQSQLINVYDVTQRLRVKDTDIGIMLRKDIVNLEKLLTAYHLGIIKEN